MDPHEHDTNGRTTTAQPADGAATATSDADALADELGRIQLRSIDDRRLRARIDTVVDHDAETIRLWYRLPHDAYAVEEFEKPIPWSDRFKFARVIEDLGYSPSSLGGIEGEEIVLERVDGEWRAEDPEKRFDDGFPPSATGGTGPIAGLGFGITVLYLLLLFVATAGAMNVVGALAAAFMLCFLTLLVAYLW
ncbi:hypothetical protein [Halalkalicoccus sp. NIPERK01]|uniref:hypothetical protein n=1 Tax=Halalkalicoccus sp. NIPERK01 TaxID=3053469 RepID=UPI00256F273B|nr:hypothetical protein [Halalkalicoccus sp. NIPERK01]MDL5361223.1 hypothetical protein [Halalkalicoccus sp. NIPERK01]